MDLDLNTLCRLCARKCEDMQNIFQENTFETEIYGDVSKDLSGMLPLKIETVTSIKVEAGDGLPAHICNECVAHLNSALIFKEKCLTADSILKHLLNSAQEAQARKNDMAQQTEKDKREELLNTNCAQLSDQSTNQDSAQGSGKSDAGSEQADQNNSSVENSAVMGEPQDLSSSVVKNGSDIEGKDNNVDNPDNDERQFTCPPCGKKYLLSAAFRKHLSLKHGMDDKNIEELVVKHNGGNKRTVKPADKKTCLCNVCGKQVNSVQFKQHIRSHEQNFQHLCTYCGKKYLTKFRLTQHIRVHTGEKPFACNICNKRFHEKSLLRSHQRRYLKQRPLKCTVCEKRFTNRSHLNTHLMIHTGEKPFRCSICFMEFRSNNHLKRHFKLHSGEKSYSCSICGKAFIQKSNYVQHLAVHREDKPFKCTECGKGFSYKCSLKMHVEVHRKKSSEQITNVTQPSNIQTLQGHGTC
ncbi:gastrula zinc finger protein XlCGF57.1-like [Periplaneta americana]|uniref:gastrula zinc finger protein XlCGF57.1-like n=1 Tax=Periplaneta americana TaxID=6978 RepID=UPI0037E72A0A